MVAVVYDCATRVYAAPSGRVRPDDQPALRDAVLAALGPAAAEATARLRAGEMTLAAWTAAMQALIRVAHAAVYMLGRGGRSLMTGGDLDRLSARVAAQEAYLARFGAELGQRAEPSPAQDAARATMYVDAARASHSDGLAAAHGGVDLPAHPCDGSTRCRTNCGCHWSLDDREDGVAATWRLGSGDSCPDCVARASRWAPLFFPFCRPPATRAAGGTSCLATPEPPDYRELTYQESFTFAEQLPTPAQAGLTAEETRALTDYKGHGYREINASLRADGTHPDVALIDSALGKSAMPADVVVYRGMSAAPFDAWKYINPAQPRTLTTDGLSALEGTILTDKGYMSTSLGSQPALGNELVWLRINVPKGTPVQYLEHITEAGEQEILLPRGSRFMIRSVTREERVIGGQATPKIIMALELVVP